MTELDLDFSRDIKRNILKFKIFYYTVFAFFFSSWLWFLFILVDNFDYFLDNYLSIYFGVAIGCLPAIFILVIAKIRMNQRSNLHKKSIANDYKDGLSRISSEEDWLYIYDCFDNFYRTAYKKNKISKSRFFLFYYLSFIVIIATFILMFIMPQYFGFIVLLGVFLWCFLIKLQKSFESSWCETKMDHTSLNRGLFLIFLFYGVILSAATDTYINAIDIGSEYVSIYILLSNILLYLGWRFIISSRLLNIFIGFKK